jgi:DNA-directed RNA polymerase subunit RPC12/RpoP
MEVFDTSYTDLITCPWCGAEFVDSWEFEDGEYDCNSCGKPFEVCHDVSITYSTAKVIK